MAHTPNYHTPVMVEEVLTLLKPLEHGVVVDATFGGGGHTRALLDAAPELSVLGLDRDHDVIPQVPEGEERVRLVTANFRNLGQVLEEPDIEEWISDRTNGRSDEGLAGVLFDFGVSSHQLDEPSRGFSYRQNGPLDMRMGHDDDLTAADIVNTWDERELAKIITRHGEERFARRIAQRIVARRPIADTQALAEAIADAVPAAAKRKRHPARKTFQALRIAVNDELTAVADGIDAAIKHLRPGGRIVVIAYHSLEDRIVKRRLRKGATGCICPPDLPVCGCGQTAELRLLTRKALRPSEAEVERNPRSRSAVVRAAEFLDPDFPGAA